MGGALHKLQDVVSGGRGAALGLGGRAQPFPPERWGVGWRRTPTYLFSFKNVTWHPPLTNCHKGFKKNMAYTELTSISYGGPFKFNHSLSTFM